MTFFFFPGKDSKAEVAPASPVGLVPEEKVSFSLCALSVSTLTVAKIRKVYNKLDSKAIAKQVGHIAAIKATTLMLYFIKATRWLPRWPQGLRHIFG